MFLAFVVKFGGLDIRGRLERLERSVGAWSKYTRRTGVLASMPDAIDRVLDEASNTPILIEFGVGW